MSIILRSSAVILWRRLELYQGMHIAQGPAAGECSAQKPVTLKVLAPESAFSTGPSKRLMQRILNTSLGRFVRFVRFLT